LSELAKRTISGSLLAAGLLLVLWAGGWLFLIVVIAAGLLVFREFARLVLGMKLAFAAQSLWLGGGAAYVSAALYALWFVRSHEAGLYASIWLFVVVWATDTGAYLAGRAIGGPKVAPAISPSKTWAGTVGGIICASLVMLAFELYGGGAGGAAFALTSGTCLSILAQVGDFSQSWMKRRAGVKDSGGLIPGHGGLFDRLDGLLPVAIVFPFLVSIV